MIAREILILAVTQMTGGLCTAGMTTDSDPVTGLRWMRPVREHSHVLLGDLTTAEGSVLRPFDVVQMDLVGPRPEPPHVEDWIANFRHCPRVLRRLEGERRATFLQRTRDKAPGEVLETQVRSLCLIRPDWIQGRFSLDEYTGKLDARIAFALDEQPYLGSPAKGGLAVTDLKWRALGRSWCGHGGRSSIQFTTPDLRLRLGCHDLALAIGLTRSFDGRHWPIVIGVHTVPDYEATVDYRNL